MIDEEINKTLLDLEKSLRELESAKNQVNTVIHSNKEVSEKISGYASSLEKVITGHQELFTSVKNGLLESVSEFEKKSLAVIKNSQEAINGINEAANGLTESIASSFEKVDSRIKQMKILMYSIIGISVASMVTIITILFLFR